MSCFYGAKMAKQNPTATKIEVGQRIVDRIINSRTFEPWYHKPKVGESFWRPIKKGDAIRGIIQKPVTNLRQSSSYPIQLDSGKTMEVIGNKQLHNLIRKADCFGQKVEIIYQGRQYLANGHYRKIYRLFKIKPGR